MSEGQLMPLGFCALTVSDTRTEATDRSGAMIVDRLGRVGHRLVERGIVEDDVPAIRAALSGWFADPAVDVVVTTGGTGITARDVTPEAVEPLVSRWIPGFGELFRQLSYADIGPATIQSRAVAGVCGATLLFVLPGSTGAVSLALEKIIGPQLDSRTRPCNFAALLPRLRSESAPGERS